jgi:hypothetical protein
MSSIHSPQEKKRKAYDCDHRSPGKYDKQFRKSWPRKKRLVNRSDRRIAKSALGGSLDPEVAELKTDKASPKTLKKWNLASVRDTVVRKLANRTSRQGGKARRKVRNANPAG